MRLGVSSPRSVRCSWLVVALLLAGCQSQPPAPVKTGAASDPTQEDWYQEETAQLAEMARQANRWFEQGKQDEAAALVMKGQPMIQKLLAVPRPTLAATEAATDIDDLYARMLFSNKNYGWARMMYQKNFSRWRHWKPETPESIARRERARAGLIACDKAMEQ